MSSTNSATNVASDPELPSTNRSEQAEDHEWSHASAEEILAMSPPRRDEDHMIYGMYLLSKSEQLCREAEQIGEEVKQLREERRQFDEQAVDERAKQLDEQLKQMKNYCEFIRAVLDLHMDDEDVKGKNLEKDNSEGGI